MNKRALIVLSDTDGDLEYLESLTPARRAHGVASDALANDAVTEQLLSVAIS